MYTTALYNYFTNVFHHCLMTQFVIIIIIFFPLIIVDVMVIITIVDIVIILVCVILIEHNLTYHKYQEGCCWI